MGGRIRAQRLSKARRKEIAKNAVQAREAKKHSGYVKTGKPRGPVAGSLPYRGKVNREEAKDLYRSGHTLEELGTRYGVTRERVRQILKKENVTASEGGQAIKTLLACEDKKESKRAQQEKTALRLSRMWELSKDEFDAIVKQYRSNTKEGSPFRRYTYQRRNARVREIEWNITFKQWWGVWQESGFYDRYGRGQGKYVMSRYGDSGAYELGNVNIILAVENSSDQERKKSGLPIGVSEKRGRFTANKMVNSKKYYIGSYGTSEEAASAYLAFVPRHKRNGKSKAAA